MEKEIQDKWTDLWANFPNEMASLDLLQERLGYRFKNLFLLYEALSHRSAIAHLGASLPWNERLEFLGDAVLGLLVSHELWNKNRELQEGGLSKIRSLLVNEKRLAEVAFGIGLGDSIVLGKGEIKAGGRKRKALLADALEAVIGAIYLDGGYDKAALSVSKLFGQWLIDIKSVENEDYKSRLQEWTQDRFQKLPVYELRHQSGPEHAREFEVWVYL